MPDLFRVRVGMSGAYSEQKNFTLLLFEFARKL